MKRALVTLIGSICYAGYFPFAPATFASFLWLLVFLFAGGGWLSSPVALIVMIPVAICVSWEMEKIHGKDSSRIVIDEFAGMQVTFFMIEPSLVVGIVGFILFRFFDILKPFPINRSQRLAGGFGVVIDDLIAGLYSRIFLLLIMRYLGVT
ncbi:MAG: phosphatidylglycerophosphatase A [Candidatus Krumholzibacteria bacterium]|nr:phosphatidylglycerophosphatase A [Candidatus Krumholzibacteria bacterium]